MIAFRRGSAAEVVDDGVSGFLVDSVEEAAAAVRRLNLLDRRAARACFERRFTVERVARDYLSIYRTLPGVRARSRRAFPELRTALDDATSWRRF